MPKAPKKGKRFRYNLQKVLAYRETKETIEQDKFTKAMQDFEQEKKKEEDLKAFQKQKYSELANQMGKNQTIDFQQVQMRKTHLEIVKQDVEKQEVVRQEAEEKKEKQRDVLIEAKKEKQILDKDKEKKKDRWKLVMRREEEKELGEIATQRYLKKQKLDQEDALNQQ